MNPRKTIAVLAFSLLLTSGGTAAELLDRIAVSVDWDVITEQQVYQQLRIASFIEGKTPEYTQQNLRDTADRMVLQRLMIREMRASGFPIPAEDDVQSMLTRLQQTHWGTEDAFWQAAQQSGISRDGLRDFLTSLLATIRYIDFRFRPAMRVSDTALLERYQERYPATSCPADPPPFEQVRQALEEELVNEGVDAAVEEWLEDAKQRAGVRYRPEVLP